MFSYARDLLGSKEMRNILILGSKFFNLKKVCTFVDIKISLILFKV